MGNSHLEHQRNSLVHLGDLCESTVNVGVDPVGTVGGETCRGCETGKVVGSLVDRGDGEAVGVTGGLDEGQDSIDCLERVGKVSGVEEPAIVTVSLANVKIVDTSGKRVKTDDAVHVVLLNGVLGDGLEVSLLVTAVKLRTWNLDPRSICGWYPQCVDSNGGKLVDGCGVQERGIASFEDWATLATECLTKSPLIRDISTTNRVPPDRVVVHLLLEPATQVCTIGLVS